MSECTFDEQDIVVVDNGSGSIKIGFSGEDTPRGVIASAVTSVTEEAKDSGGAIDSRAVKSTTFFGDAAWENESRGTIKLPLHRGATVDRDVLELLWDHALESLGQVEWEEMPFLVTEPPLNPRAEKTWLAEFAFEKLKVRSLSLVNSALLALLSTGRTSGLVMDLGHGMSHAVPIYEGYALHHATFSADVAGMDVTHSMTKLFEAVPAMAEYVSRTSTFLMKEMKEKLCRVAPEPLNRKVADLSHENMEQRLFELPDGTIIEVPSSVRYGAPEILFVGEKTLQTIGERAIGTCDKGFQFELAKNVVIGGGTSMIPGLSQRLKRELRDVVQRDVAKKVEIVTDSHRRYATWIGGSMLASLSTVDHFLITRQEYEEGRTDLATLVGKKSL